MNFHKKLFLTKWKPFVSLDEETAAYIFNLYLHRHSPWAGWTFINNWVDHVSDGLGLTVLFSLETFTQSFLHRAWLKTRGPKIGFRTAHVFSWPPARLRHVRGGVGRRRSSISSLSRHLAAWPNQWSLLCTSSASTLIRQRRRRVECGGCCHCQRPPKSFRRILVQPMTRSRRAKLSALLPCRPCPLSLTKVTLHFFLFKKME